jgi:hypothetical protein
MPWFKKLIKPAFQKKVRHKEFQKKIEKKKLKLALVGTKF